MKPETRESALEIAFGSGLVLCTAGISLWSVGGALVFLGLVLSALAVVGKLRG